MKTARKPARSVVNSAGEEVLHGRCAGIFPRVINKLRSCTVQNVGDRGNDPFECRLRQFLPWQNERYGAAVLADAE